MDTSECKSTAANKSKIKKAKMKARFSILTDFLNEKSNQPMDAAMFTEILDTEPMGNVTGRTLLARLLASPRFGFVDELHTIIKDYFIKLNNKSQVSSIGEIYLKAWKNSEGERRKLIESNCIQVLIRAALMTKHQVAEYCLEALKPFFDQRLLLNIDAMTYTLAEPLIWRSLEAANHEARFNAIKMLIAMYPLRDQEVGPTEQLQLMERQMRTFEKFLKDEIVEIRTATIAGVCRILSLYWELICPQDLSRILKYLIEESAFDANNVEGRVAVLRGMCLILDNPRSHLSLELLLPTLGKLIHDKPESVRSAMVDLLLATVPLKVIKFWNVVKIDHIIRRLAAEKSVSISERVAQLMMSSYFPAIVADSQERAKRALALFAANMVASRKFYRYAAKLAPIGVTVEYIMFFINCVYYCAKVAQGGEVSFNNSSAASSSDDESSGDARESQTATTETSTHTPRSFDKPVLIGFLDCAAIMWSAIAVEVQKDENEALWKMMQKKGGGMLMRCATYYEDDTDVYDSVLVLIGLLSKSTSKRYLEGSLNKKMQTIEEGGFDRKLHGSVIEALCHLQLKDIAGRIVKWWRSFSSPILTPSSNTPPPPRSKRVRISVPDVERSCPRLGVQVVAYLLDRTGTRRSIVRSHMDLLRDLESALVGLWDHCLSLPEKSDFNAKWIGEIMKLRTVMAVLMYSKGGGCVEASKFLASLMDQLRTNVWPAYNQEQSSSDLDTSDASGSTISQDRLERATMILKISFDTFGDFIKCGLGDGKGLDLASELTDEVMKNESDTTFNEAAMHLIYHILDQIRHKGVSAEIVDKLQPWIQRADQFAKSIKDGEAIDGAEEVGQLIARFGKALKGN